MCWEYGYPKRSFYRSLCSPLERACLAPMSQRHMAWWNHVVEKQTHKTGWWYTNPSEKWVRQLGWSYSQDRESKKCSKAPSSESIDLSINHDCVRAVQSLGTSWNGLYKLIHLQIISNIWSYHASLTSSENILNYFSICHQPILALAQKQLVSVMTPHAWPTWTLAHSLGGSPEECEEGVQRIKLTRIQLITCICISYDNIRMYTIVCT